MKTSHTFSLYSLALASTLLLSSLPGFSQVTNPAEIDLYPSNSTARAINVSGTFVMNFQWNGVKSRMESIKWNNFGIDNSGSAYLTVKTAEGVILFQGYPTELGDLTHEFTATSEIVLETGVTYILEFDLSQVKVSTYSNQNSFPWLPVDSSPIEIKSTQLIGIVDQPVDPDIVFPYFTMNMVYGIGVEESSLEDWAVYPNPAVDWISLPTLESEATVEFYSNAGQLISSQEVESHTTSISTSELPAGIYVVAIKTDNNLIARTKLTVL